MNARDTLWLGVCFLALGVVIATAAAASMVERTQPVIVDIPQRDVLQVADKPMYNIVVFGPESEVDNG